LATMRIEVIQSLKQALEQDGNQSLRPAKPETLDLARKAGFPDELIEFYRDHEPASWCVQLGSDEPGQAERRLHCIAAAIEETFDDAPGLVLFPLGYVTFASNGSGDAYCIDTNVTTAEGEHPVTLFALETIREGTEVSYIEKSRLEVASSLEDFLTKFTTGGLIDMPLYPPKHNKPAK
jgi:SMI1/KNR4 family protein SUKH-1